MSPSGRSARVLIIEHVPDLRDLEALILTEAGYLVETPPDESDPVTVAEQKCPDVIVLGIRPTELEDKQLVHRLEADPKTRAIPVVVISTSEQEAAIAQASPIAHHTIVAPYDIQALENAVAGALKHPPPAAVLPTTRASVPAAVAFAADAMSKEAQQIVLRTLRSLQKHEPYKSSFPRLTKGLVDDLGIIVGAIVTGLRRQLSPNEVFSTPEIRDSIERHVSLRANQGLDSALAIREDQALQAEIDEFLRRLIGHQGFTAMDALDVSRQIRPYVDELIRIIVKQYR